MYSTAPTATNHEKVELFLLKFTGRPTMTWKRSLDKELKEMGLTWGEVKRIAKTREASLEVAYGHILPMDKHG